MSKINTSTKQSPMNDVRTEKTTINSILRETLEIHHLIRESICQLENFTTMVCGEELQVASEPLNEPSSLITLLEERRANIQDINNRLNRCLNSLQETLG